MAGHLTLALIKPHAVLERNVGKIIQRIEAEGFAIVAGKMFQFLPEGAEEFYGEHHGRPFFPNLVKVMSASPCWVLVLYKPNAVEEWRQTIGATHPAEAEAGTIRAEFGHHHNVTNNAVHGSADDWAAQREINFFFGRDLQLAEKARRLRDEEKLAPRRA